MVSSKEAQVLVSKGQQHAQLEKLDEKVDRQKGGFIRKGQKLQVGFFPEHFQVSLDKCRTNRCNINQHLGH
ncbi:hypothetical protein ADIS_0925 [Lunatimonas lonarensis]|uniref:Uncharacterized protein n=1 Tax=Lunatimonas lonarensis TaxID=1232681 RepID=R7ZWQ4_9BACT|nr:hypothetical protein ADIS_0925 [Lunatimonas lonarensis]